MSNKVTQIKNKKLSKPHLSASLLISFFLFTGLV